MLVGLDMVDRLPDAWKMLLFFMKFYSELLIRPWVDFLIPWLLCLR